MDISGVSSQAMSGITGAGAGQIPVQISMAIMKQQQDQTQQFAQALVQMIQTTTPEGAGQIVNKTA